VKRFLATAAIALSCHAAHAAETVGVFAPDSFRQIVAGKAGKPFVVMLWSLDCVYCAQSFEALSDAKKKHGLDVVTIATDPADDPESVKLISGKLAAHRLTGNAWAFGSSPPEQLRYAIAPKWRGELPRSYWFGADGKVVAYSGVVSKERISAHIGK
jgi:hypothetical protein